VVPERIPCDAQLPRSTAQAEAKGVNTLLNFSSRPFRPRNFTVRYRYNQRDVQTPTFDATEYVRFDAVPEEIEEGLSHQFDTSRHIFDANVSFTPARWGTLRVGYGHEAVERHGRGFSDVGEHIFRVSFDTFSSRWVTVRAGFDVARRRGEGFVETGIDYELGPGGTQPTLRYYDEANRDRTRGSLLFTVMPRDTVDVYVSFAGGKDEYMADTSVPVSRPGELFGLQDSDVTSWNAGVNGGPRIAALASLNQFIPLPDVENTWHRATADVQYFFTSRAGIGGGYYFEKLDIVDFNTIDTNGPGGFTPATGAPRIDWPGGLITGYGNRPYTGHTAYVRLLYRF
jgi:hypothetical protein